MEWGATSLHHGQQRRMADPFDYNGDHWGVWCNGSGTPSYFRFSVPEFSTGVGVPLLAERLADGLLSFQ